MSDQPVARCDGVVPAELTTTDPGTTMREWNEEFDLLTDFMPFRYRHMDAIEILLVMRDIVEILPVTAETFRMSDFCDTQNPKRDLLPMEPSQIQWRFPWPKVIGSMPITENCHKANRYFNPSYIHLKNTEPSVTDTHERVELLYEFSEFGWIELEDVAPLFGQSTEECEEFVESTSFDWDRRQKTARDRLARTVETTLAWSDYDLETLCRAFDIDRDTLEWHLPNHEAKGVSYDYTPPEDPSSAVWFAPGSYYRHEEGITA